jgi:hypothetical protein
MKSWLVTFIAMAPIALLAAEWFDLTDWEWWAMVGGVVWYGVIRDWSRP